MKYISMLIWFFILNVSVLSGQSNPGIGITFGTQTFDITKADKTSGTITGDDIAFFYEHFQQEDYQKYRAYYYNNTCLATEDEYRAYRTQMRSRQFRPLARYILSQGNEMYSIISYSISNGSIIQYFPLALQKKDNKWYLLDLRQSEALIGLKMFLSYVHPELIIDFLREPEAMKAKYMSTIFTSKGKLNGDLLMNIYEARYDETTPMNALSKEVFHPIAEYPQEQNIIVSSEMAAMAEEYNLPQKEKAILKNICLESNYNLALQKLAEWSGTSDVVQMSEQFNRRINSRLPKN